MLAPTAVTTYQGAGAAEAGSRTVAGLHRGRRGPPSGCRPSAARGPAAAAVAAAAPRQQRGSVRRRRRRAAHPAHSRHPRTSASY